MDSGLLFWIQTLDSGLQVSDLGLRTLAFQKSIKCQKKYLIEAEATFCALVGHGVQVLARQADWERAGGGGGGARPGGGEPLGAVLTREIQRLETYYDMADG